MYKIFPDLTLIEYVLQCENTPLQITLLKTNPRKTNFFKPICEVKRLLVVYFSKGKLRAENKFLKL